MSIHQLLDLVKNAQAVGPILESTHPGSGFARFCRDYTDLDGRPFKGSESVIEIQARLRSCDHIFSRTNLVDLHRVQMASSMLQERALDWYEPLILEIIEADLTWKQFQERFELKFMPEAEKVTLARRFIDLVHHLVQGESSVMDYVAPFESLSKYGVKYINTSLKKNQRFVYGLNKNLKNPLLLKLEVSFDQLIDIALRLEEADNESDVEVMGSKQNFNNNMKRPIKFKGPNPNKKGKQETPVANASTSSRGQCYNCGSTGHYAWECPKPLYCRCCKSLSHHISMCPILQSKKEGKLNVVQASNGTSLGQGISHSILDDICL